jgi:hypothetical protein
MAAGGRNTKMADESMHPASLSQSQALPIWMLFLHPITLLSLPTDTDASAVDVGTL